MAESAATERLRGDVPFWMHQVVEMLLGVLVMIEGARDGNHTAVVVSLGATLLLMSLLSDGALGAWTLIGRRLHRAFDALVVGAFAVAPLVFSISDALPIVVLEGAALALAWLWFRTQWVKRAGTRRFFPTFNRHRMADATTEAVPATPPADPAADSAPAEIPVARRLGAVAGRMRDDGPRTAGRIVGRVMSRARSRRPGS